MREGSFLAHFSRKRYPIDVGIMKKANEQGGGLEAKA